MDIRGKQIGGWDAVRVRDALRAFLDIETVFSFEGGQLRWDRKTVKADFLAQQLGVGVQQVEDLLNILIADNYIDEDKRTPTEMGMALAHAEDRNRLPLSEAHSLLDQFLAVVSRVNARPGLRMTIDRVYVFGSYHAGANTVGDVDLLIEMPVPETAEDFDERDTVSKEILISEYLSFHEEVDAVAGQAEKRLIYERSKVSLPPDGLEDRLESFTGADVAR
ncbi:hypothetical protein ACIPR8_16950 [Stenotrophomonas sp. LARHCG68]